MCCIRSTVRRGPVVDSEALYWALKNGQMAAAALDVTGPEPLLFPVNVG